MPMHHLALATPNMTATHAFYTEAMGFDLVKVVVAPSPEGGWAKHYFYDIGDGLIAFWDLHMEGVIDRVPGAISRDLGLPEWVNHVAFDARDHEAYQRARQRWDDLGLDVVEVDHEFCRSAYTIDPNGTLVEWCQNLRSFTPDERERAVAALTQTEPDSWDPTPEPAFITGDRSRRPAWMPRDQP